MQRSGFSKSKPATLVITGSRILRRSGKIPESLLEPLNPLESKFSINAR